MIFNLFLIGTGGQFLIGANTRLLKKHLPTKNHRDTRNKILYKYGLMENMSPLQNNLT
jgi:hypothetical protein